MCVVGTVVENYSTTLLIKHNSILVMWYSRYTLIGDVFTGNNWTGVHVYIIIKALTGKICCCPLGWGTVEYGWELLEMED